MPGRIATERCCGLPYSSHCRPSSVRVVCAYTSEFQMVYLFAKCGSPRAVVESGRQDRPRLHLALDGPLDDPSAGEEVDDPAPDPPRRPPMAAGTPIFGFLASDSATKAQFRLNVCVCALRSDIWVFSIESPLKCLSALAAYLWPGVVVCVCVVRNTR